MSIFKEAYIFLLTMFALIIFTTCSKEEKAEPVIADRFAGKYVAEDTTYSFDSTNQLVSKIRRYNFEIIKMNNNQVQLINFGQDCTLTADASISSDPSIPYLEFLR